MNMRTLAFMLLVLSFVLSGCFARTYQLTRDRVDQDLTGGNRGYLLGGPSSEEPQDRKMTRTTQVVEIELAIPKFKKLSDEEPIEDVSTQPTGAVSFERSQESAYISSVPQKTDSVGSFEKYTVKKNDTLQKISKNFYGTTKRWHKIYEFNKDVLKKPNSIRPGQVLKIPVESLKETQENLK